MDEGTNRHPFLELDAQRMRRKRHGGTLVGASSPLKVTTSSLRNRWAAFEQTLHYCQLL